MQRRRRLGIGPILRQPIDGDGLYFEIVGPLCARDHRRWHPATVLIVQRVLEHGERDAARGVDHPVPARCPAAARVQPASAGEDLTLMPALGEPIDRGQA